MGEPVSVSKDIGEWMRIMQEAGTAREPAIEMAKGLLRQEERHCRRVRERLEEFPDAYSDLWKFAALEAASLRGEEEK